jgi:hypothetical protein
MKKPDKTAKPRKTAQVFHRALPEVIALLDKLTATVKKEVGVDVSKSKVVEMAIREMAKKRKITA